MRIRFFRGNDGVKEVETRYDYLFDNGACIQIKTKNPWKKQHKGFETWSCWVFPKSKFQKLLKDGYVEKSGEGIETGIRLTYYKFTSKIDSFDGEFK